jgi:AcrR family transcriptional regulator
VSATAIVSPAPSDRQILDCAVAVFAAKGYHGASIREIASRAGVSVAGIYHHFPSKQHLLARLMDDTMDALIARTQKATAEASECPVALLSAAVAAHVRYHVEYREHSFVGNSELRSLVSPARERVLRKRDRQRAIFEDAVRRGAAEGVFDVEFPADTVRAIVTMCTAVATWYRPRGPLTPEELADRYVTLALRLVGYRNPGGPRSAHAVPPTPIQEAS